MHRRHLLARALVLAAAVTGVGCRTADPTSSRPNLLVIMTDDQRWDTLTSQAMPYVVSRLQGHGVTFTNAFATTATCCPARVSFLTGNLASRHGVHINRDGALLSVGPDRDTLATRLKGVGYRTGIVGKYLNDYQLLGPPHRDTWYIPPGWDAWAVFRDNGDNYVNYTLVTGPQTTVQFTEDSIHYSTDEVAERARAFIESAPDTSPFFLLVTPFGPHLGREMVPRRHLDRFVGIAPARPPSFNEADMSDKAELMQSGLIVDPMSTSDLFRRLQLEALLSVDELVQTLVRAVEGRARETVIVFTSDQGFFWGEHRIGAGKSKPYDEAHRIPLVIVYPRLLGDTPWTEAGLVTHQDLAATLAEWGGAKPPGQDGISFASTLPQRLPLAREVVPLEGWNPKGPLYLGTRTMTEKVIRWHTGEVERYLYPQDPHELTSVPVPP